MHAHPEGWANTFVRVVGDMVKDHIVDRLRFRDTGTREDDIGPIEEAFPIETFPVQRELIADLTQLPHQATQFYTRAARGDLQVRPELTKLERNVRRVERAVIRLTAGIAASALFIGGVMLRVSGEAVTWPWWAAGLLLAWALWPRMAMNS